MVGAMKYQAGEPGPSPSVVTYFFSFFFLKNTLKFCSAGQIACVSMHPVTDE